MNEILNQRISRRNLMAGFIGTAATMGILKTNELLKNDPAITREEYCEDALVPRGYTAFVGPSMRSVDTAVYAETGSFYEAEKSIECAKDEE